MDDIWTVQATFWEFNKAEKINPHTQKEAP